MARPLILLSNDDGYQSHGIRVVREVLLEYFDVVICAPAGEQSAASHALTLHRPLRLMEHEPDIYSVDGTPADCVFVALNSDRALPRRPDLVVSGINHGVNLGDDVFYSGTVAAAREGALKGVAALAVSASEKASWEAAAAVSCQLARAMLEASPRPRLLNANFPPGKDWPLRGTRLGHRRYKDAVEFREDPRGREYLWLGGGGVEHSPMSGADTEAFDAGEVGVTPLILDLWDTRIADQAQAVAARASALKKP